MVEAGERLLPAEEPEASQAVEVAFTAEGIRMCTGEAAREVGLRAGSIAVRLDGGEKLTGERLLVVTGRAPDISGLGLAAAGLDGDAQYIQVDERMRAADGIWAMGDVTGKAMYTHVALYQSAIIAAEILARLTPLPGTMPCRGPYLQIRKWALSA